MYSFSKQALNAPRSDVRELLQFAKRPDMISFSGGLPASELFDVEGIRAASEACLREAPDSALQYGTTEGQPQLREALVRHLAGKGLKLSADELVITTGSQQAIDLVARSLLNPGDVVALERPTYLAALQTFKLSGAQTLSVDSDHDGGCFHQLESLPKDQLPKLVYVVSNFANPTGRSLSLERRIALLHWAARMKVFVLEDDPYGELRTHGQALPSMAATGQRHSGRGRMVRSDLNLFKDHRARFAGGLAACCPTLSRTSGHRQTGDGLAHVNAFPGHRGPLSRFGTLARAFAKSLRGLSRTA